VSPTHFGLPQYLTALIKKKYGIGGRAKKLNRVGHTRIYAWGVVPKSACLVGVVGLDMKL
jgi:hypothetical protein